MGINFIMTFPSSWITILKVWWLEWRYNLQSGADNSKALYGAVAGARIKKVDWKDAKPESGLYGRTTDEARLNALNFWIRKHTKK